MSAKILAAFHHVGVTISIIMKMGRLVVGTIPATGECENRSKSGKKTTAMLALARQSFKIRHSDNTSRRPLELRDTALSLEH